MSVARATAGGTAADDPGALLDRLAHLLPAQGPISIFIHHNTLHAFEHLPFEEAVEHAARRFGRDPFLPEARYRDKLASGRILASDVEAVIGADLGERADHLVAGVATRADLWRAVVLHGIPSARGRELGWILEETPALSRYRADLPARARAAFADVGEDDGRRVAERQSVRALWDGCLGAVRRGGDVPPATLPAPIRHRDWLIAADGPDVNAWFHPTLIRFLAGYLDQGLAPWAMPRRELGIHGCFLEMFDTSLAARCGRWAQDLPRVVADDAAAGRNAVDSIAHSLEDLGVPVDERAGFLTAELLALAGWAGMVRQIEERPDRVPVRDVIVTLRGYMAVRLLLERAALLEASRRIGFDGPLAGLRAWLEPRVPGAAPVTDAERAWRLFNLSQLLGLDAVAIDALTAAGVAAMERELDALHDVGCRRLLHLAFERTVRHPFYDALAAHQPHRPAEPPAFQAVFCLDEREESFRRHLEEIDPACETFAAAGFFNVAMYHQGATDAHPRPLCPVAVVPQHFVEEVETPDRGVARRSRQLHRRAAGFLGYNVHVGSRLPMRGALLTAAVGWLALVPLIARVVFPWLTSRWRRVSAAATSARRTRLLVDRTEARPPVGAHSGFTVREMADIVRRLLDDIGIVDRLAPMVLVIGHGSVSLNNPHESAHDCGACGGGRGGPNARAFAQMANDPRVRDLLSSEGLHIDSGTWFVGAQRNTCSNEVMLFDDDLVPAGLGPLLMRMRASIDTARRREAHERCRRFDAAPPWFPPLAALAHVEGRAADLAQPRPEYGHATNAFCLVGRRARTRGLFLDRRAFLVSYDPSRDADGAILSRLLAAVVPVVVGINLEYYFSYVDPTGYGCGTKLPHNVTSLVGVMDGAQSDLRTGLPWQMVEIHEPARLTLVVEAPPDRLETVVHANTGIERLVRNRWLWLGCLEPLSDRVWEMTDAGFVLHVQRRPLPIVPGDSSAWYGGRRGFVPPAAIAGTAAGA